MVFSDAFDDDGVLSQLYPVFLVFASFYLVRFHFPQMPIFPAQDRMKTDRCHNLPTLANSRVIKVAKALHPFLPVSLALMNLLEYCLRPRAANVLVLSYPRK